MIKNGLLTFSRHYGSNRAKMLQKVNKKHTLVLLRHGESTWNQLNRFTGWYGGTTERDIDGMDRDRQRGLMKPLVAHWASLAHNQQQLYCQLPLQENMPVQDLSVLLSYQI